tara:strand:- start:1071 stop:5618 length:4548 start_codon:yes stop_codon:yes gene_type:complete
MCISDNSCSISVEGGNFNSQQLSCSYFPASLGNYPWNFTPIETTIIDGPYSNDSSFMTNLINGNVEPEMSFYLPDSSPANQTGSVQFFDGSEVDIYAPTTVSAATGDRVIFEKTTGLVSCSIFMLSESVQTKDRENACVDFLMFFVSSGSGAPNYQPTTHIFTDDGFDFTTTPSQEILVWQGGWTTQNAFVPANQLSIGTPLVSWVNDIYQYVQITSMSYDDNNAVGVNWTTTGTNSYQLENGVVIRGFIDDYCSCSPSASINDIPCGSTASFCVSESIIIRLSGSESGNSNDGGGGGTVKSWTISPSSNTSIGYTTTFANNNQELTASYNPISSSGISDICYTETRYLGPIDIHPFVFATAEIPIVSVDSVVSGTQNNQYNYSGSAADYDFFNSMGTVFAWSHNAIQASATTAQSCRAHWVLCDGSDANLTTQLGTGSTYHGSSGESHHFFCSDSADYGTLGSSHPSYSNAAYSLAWKINSASLHGNFHRHQFQLATLPTYPPPWDALDSNSGLHQFPSASYAYKPVNIVKDSSAFVGFSSDYSSTYEGNKLHLIAIDTGSWCPNPQPYSLEETTTLAIDQHTTPTAEGLPYWHLIHPQTNPYNVGVLTVNNASVPPACPFTSSYGIIASDTCCAQFRLNRQPSASFGSHVCQINFGTSIKLDQQFPIYNADTIVWSLGGNAQGSFQYHDTQSNSNPTSLIVDQATHAQGVITLCYTASSANAKCTDNADELSHIPATLTPNCCPAISGCVDLYFNPGISAGANAIHCFPTMSLTGLSPVYTFTNTDVSEPTWSCIGAELQYEDFDINPVGNLSSIGQFVPGLGTFGQISNFTNSYATEIHLNPDHTDDLNFGWFTMSLQVSNGPCTFTDASRHYVARVFADAGPDRHDCIGIGTEGQSGPINGEGFMTLQATSSTFNLPDGPGAGFWEYIVPTSSAPIGPALIFEPNNPNSAIRVAHCEETVTIRWTAVGDTTVEIEGETYSITCTDSVNSLGSQAENYDVQISKKMARSPILMVGHSSPTNPFSPGALITSSVSASYHPPLYDVGDGMNLRTTYGASALDTVECMHIFNGDQAVHTASIHYVLPTTVLRDEIIIPVATRFQQVPNILGNEFSLRDNNDERMFKWKDGTGTNINNLALASSESNASILSQSRDFLPTVGGNNPSNKFPSSSVFYMSSSHSSSYAPRPHFTGDGGAGFFYLAVSASMDDCNCREGGAQARLFFHQEIEELQFAFIQGNFQNINGGIGDLDAVTEGGVIQLELEPNLGINIPTYKNIEGLHFISQSVNVLHSPAGFTTMSSVITLERNPCAPFLTASWKCPETTLNINNSLMRTTQLQEQGFFWMPRDATNQNTYPHNTANTSIPFYLHPERGTGISNAGTGMTFEWNAVELFKYRDFDDEGNPGLNHFAATEITGTFLDSFTSRSVFENPSYLPANRTGSNTVAGLDAFDSGDELGPETGRWYANGDANQQQVTTSSVMFQVTGTVNDCNRNPLKTYYASCSVMFFRDSPFSAR